MSVRPWVPRSAPCRLPLTSPGSGATWLRSRGKEVPLPLEGEGTNHAFTLSSAHPHRTKFNRYSWNQTAGSFFDCLSHLHISLIPSQSLPAGPISPQSSEGWRLPWSRSVKSICKLYRLGNLLHTLSNSPPRSLSQASFPP